LIFFYFSIDEITTKYNIYKIFECKDEGNLILVGIEE
jgi:hypothetical protein